MPSTKLVRDKIPQLMRAQGMNPVNHIAGEKEFAKALLAKLQEEVEEFINNPCQEEMADIMEVIYAILEQKHYRFAEIEKVRKKKAQAKGAFKKRIIAHLDKKYNA